MKGDYVSGLSKDPESPEERRGRSLLVPIIIVLAAIAATWVWIVNSRTNLNRNLQKDIPAENR